MKKIGVLAFHGDVKEHTEATERAAAKKRIPVHLIEVRTRVDLKGLDALILPGGESTTLQMLCEREGMFPAMKRIPNIFGTCAGAILLAKRIENMEEGQKTLRLMDIMVARNAYGRQTDSAEREVNTPKGSFSAAFIRAPKIRSVGNGVVPLAYSSGDVVLCEQRTESTFYLAATFHPELTTTRIHEYFLQNLT